MLTAENSPLSLLRACLQSGCRGSSYLLLKAPASPEKMGADVRSLGFGSDKDLDQNIKQKYFRESFWEEVSYMGSMACQAF